MGCALWVVAIGVAVVLAATAGGLGIFLAVIVLALAGGIHWYVRTQVAAPVQTEPVVTPTKISRPAHEANPTQLAERKITRLGTQGWQEVVGEHYHQEAIARVVGKRALPPEGQWDAGLRLLAYLMREPSNRHDRNAIMVQLANGHRAEHVGYLPARIAARWQPLLIQLEADGRVGECRALGFRGRNGTPQIVLRLSDPEDALLGNAEPDDAELLDAERQCAVTGEQHHQDVLAQWEPGPVWATLHPAAVPSGKYAGQPTIEVRIDGDVVGTLAAAQGERYAQLLAGGRVACEARVFDGSRHREVTLMLPKVD